MLVRRCAAFTVAASLQPSLPLPLAVSALSMIPVLLLVILQSTAAGGGAAAAASVHDWCCFYAAFNPADVGATA